ncbi:dinitrogenase iron-molybdenum cofactor, partial [Escherichia coli]|nr:dinitrogenase iron-molybdenum cofactor [Escherichia coli]
RVLTELNKPEQGRQSFHHEAKGKKCCHSDGNTAENACQGGRQHHHGNGRCCHS